MRKKILLLALSSILLTPSAWAEVGITDAGNNVWHSCAKQSDGTSIPSMYDLATNLVPYPSTTGCSGTIRYLAYRGSNTQNVTQYIMHYVPYCTSCQSGYTLTEVTDDDAYDCRVTWTLCQRNDCQDTICEGFDTYQSYSSTSSNHNVVRCNKTTNKCEYACDEGYYDAEVPLVGVANKTCRPCPTGGDCPGGGAQPDICCDSGRYLSSLYSSLTGYTKSCKLCPTLGTNEVPAITKRPTGSTTLLWCGATDITQCWIPANTDIEDAAGTYRFASDCQYKTTTSVTPVYPTN